MEDKGIFRSSIGGFNKSDVLAYIDQITAAWDRERQELTQTAEQARQEADTAQAQAQLAKAQAAQAGTEADSARARTEELQKQLTALQEQLAAVCGQLDAANGQLAARQAQAEQDQKALRDTAERLRAAESTAAALRQQVAEEQEKARSAVAEMMAAEDRLSDRETELTQQSRQLQALAEQKNRYESLLGCGSAPQAHVEGLVRPVMEDTRRRADSALEDVDAALHALLAQCGELSETIRLHRDALQAAYADGDRRLSETLRGWLEAARPDVQTVDNRPVSRPEGETDRPATAQPPRFFR